MSDPKRFDHLSDGMWQNSAGDYVLYSDYARLKAEVEEYKKVVSTDHVDLFAQNARLKAEVERLRKAGDNLARAADENGCHDNGDAEDLDDSIDRWNAAKEGKQP